MANLPIRDDLFMMYGLYPEGLYDLRFVLWYLNPKVEEYFAKNMALITNEGVIVIQQGDKIIITKSTQTMDMPATIVLPRLQGKNSSCTSIEKAHILSRTPRPEMRGPTRIILPASEGFDSDTSTIVTCLTEHHRAGFAINIARTLYQLTSQTAAQLETIAWTELINV